MPAGFHQRLNAALACVRWRSDSFRKRCGLAVDWILTSKLTGHCCQLQILQSLLCSLRVVSKNMVVKKLLFSRPFANKLL